MLSKYLQKEGDIKEYLNDAYNAPIVDPHDDREELSQQLDASDSCTYAVGEHDEPEGKKIYVGEGVTVMEEAVGEEEEEEEEEFQEKEESQEKRETFEYFSFL